MTVPAQVAEVAQLAMPRRRPGYTTAVTIGGEQFCLTANAATDGSLGEVFIQWGKHGTGAAGLADLYASALSMALRYRVPLSELVRSSLGLRFAPDGRTDDPDIPMVGSVADYVARRLAIDWLPRDERSSLGIYTMAERLSLAAPWAASREVTPTAKAAGTGTTGIGTTGIGTARAGVGRALIEQGADVVGV
jgi:hypothetical protein